METHGRDSVGLRNCEYILSKYDYKILGCKILLGPEFWGQYLWEKYFPLHIPKQHIDWNSMFIRLFFVFFWGGRVTPAAYGSSQARGWIGAAAACLHHSNRGSEVYLRPTLQLTITLDPQPTEQSQESNPYPHRQYDGFLTCWATMGTPIFFL